MLGDLAVNHFAVIVVGGERVMNRRESQMGIVLLSWQFLVRARRPAWPDVGLETKGGADVG